MSETRQPRTERWIASRHVDRVLSLTASPAFNPDLPSEQYNAALAQAVRGLIGIAGPHAIPARYGRWMKEAQRIEHADDWLGLFNDIYACLHASGLLRPAPLEEDEL